MNSKQVLAAALILASSQMAVADKSAKAQASSSKGKCYGVAGIKESDCGGKNPKTGESWSCKNHNPSVEGAWKTTTKAECDAMKKHPDASKKHFVANKK